MLHPVYYTEWFRPENIPPDVFYDSKKHTWLSYDRSLEHIVLNGEITERSKSLIKHKKILFVHGDHDRTAPYERARAFASHFSNSRFMTIDNGDHQIYLTHHDAIWQQINDYFYE
jgi:pimeloyl-ACP methyl ester carboxylesterase